MVRLMRARVRLAAGLVVATAAMMSGAVPAEAGTVYTGTWRCNDRGQLGGIAGARVELVRRPVGAGDQVVARGWTTSAGRSRRAGHFRLETTARGANAHFVRLLLHDRRRVRVLLPGGAMASATSALALNDRAEHDFGEIDLGWASTSCAVFRGMRAAYADYVGWTGERPPFGTLTVKAESLVAGSVPIGVPFTLHTVVHWPAAEPTGPAAGDVSTAFHEFGHSIRHALDGGMAHFLFDVDRYQYYQHHDRCQPTNLGFAFNEGWARYWARDVTGCPNRTDLSVEGNVAAALAKLDRECVRVTRGTLVDVLRRNRWRIHSFADLSARLPCTRLIVPQKSIAGVKLDMTEGQVAAIVGQPDRTRVNTHPIFGTSTVASYRAAGIDAVFVAGRVTSVSTTSSGLRTPRDVGVGSTRRAVRNRVNAVRCERFSRAWSSCYVGSYRAGTVVTDFRINASGTVRRVTIGYVVD